jgi:hypothetical protein
MCATYPLACDAQVWSLKAVIDGEGEDHASSCQMTKSGEGRAMSLD